MTRCYVYLKNTSRYVVKVIGFRGSDWGGINNAIHQPHESNFTVVQSMGCPSAGTESDHWGWLYLLAHPVDDSNLTKYFVVFVRIRHSGQVVELGMDWTYMKSDDEKPEYLPPRSLPKDGEGHEVSSTENLSNSFPPLGQLSWYPDKSDQDWRLRDGERGAPVVEITFSL